jgi:hypothetical protein
MKTLGLLGICLLAAGMNFHYYFEVNWRLLLAIAIWWIWSLFVYLTTKKIPLTSWINICLGLAAFGLVIGHNIDNDIVLLTMFIFGFSICIVFITNRFAKKVQYEPNGQTNL